MSSTNKTANYNLSQFIGSDKPAWLVDYNGDMAAIDTQMKANADAAADAQTTATGADGKADTNATAISTLDTQINGASGIADDITTLQGSVNTISSLIGNGEPTTTDKTIIGAINELHSSQESDESSITALQGLTVFANVPEIASVTADGVKTYKDLLNELHANLQTAVSALASGKHIRPVRLAWTGYDMYLPNPYVMKNNTTIGSMNFHSIYTSDTEQTISVARVHGSNSHLTTTALSSTVAITDLEDTVPADGVKITMYGYTD